MLFYLKHKKLYKYKIVEWGIKLIYKSNWSPRRYCKYAVTNNPANVTGTNPSTIPDKRGSTIKTLIFLFKCLISTSTSKS